MHISKTRIITYAVIIAALVIFAAFDFAKAVPFLIPFIFAHCDTESGPVIQAAKKALETKNVDLVLIWVQKKDEAELRKAFEKTLDVRKLNPKAKELADHYFFETLVRIHRAGEGAPYTGIKPAGSEEPAIAAADKAVETGSVDGLAKEISSLAHDGIRERFNLLMEKKKHMNESVDAGREYIETYVTFIHYVEKLNNDAAGGAVPGDTSEDSSGHHGH